MFGGVAALANLIGASEPALRLLLSVLLGYPIAYVYRQHIYSKTKFINHLYIILCGISILLFNYGYDFYHTLLAIGVSCLFIHTLQGNVLIASTFIFHMGYLLIGYLATGTDTYDIKWTMPHCVLVLRLIGLSFDVSDGQRPVEELSVANKQSCLKEIPGPIEVFAFCLFPASVLVGPQFPMRRYKSFIAKEFGDYNDNIMAGLRRGGIGMLYLLMNQVGGAMIPDDYLLSDEYQQRSLLYKWIIMGLWGKITLYKYISCWLLTEGAATCFGLTYNGQKNGENDWSGCENIKLTIFENASSFQHYIDSFNVNTNRWTAEYIFKRLKFLNNRYISHAGALFFLAIWHGFHSGYYMCFFMEFVIMQYEKQIQSVLNRSEPFQAFLRQPGVDWLVFCVLKFYTLVGMGWCMIPFSLLSVTKWWPIYKTVGFYGFIVYLPYPLYKMMLKKILPMSPRPTSSDSLKSKVQ